VASRIEIERSGPSYSVDTIRTFGGRLRSTSIAFIIGMDAFREMHTWREYREIPRLCDLIVTSRPGFPTPAIEDLLPVALRSAFWYDSSKHRYQHDSGHTLTLFALNGLHISASAVRENSQLGQSLNRQVPPAVSAYISEHGLYTKREDIC
jgi:nicotinate-nucleotide adenylyltransferase